MKKIKVFYGEERLRDIYPHATKWEVFKWKVRKFFRRVLQVVTVGGVAGGLIYAAFIAGAYFNPKVTYATVDKMVEVEGVPVVLQRIAGCESQGKAKSEGSHLAKNGQVVVHANTNGTVDAGIFQINVSVWGKKATELGYNLFTEEGNKSMALWIYHNVGTSPWTSSSKCWQ